MEAEPPSSRPTPTSRAPSKPPGSTWLSIAARSETGHVRSHNEDVAFVATPERGCQLLGVCDGMGGANAGEVASALAARVIQSELSLRAGVPWELALEEALRAASLTIHGRAEQEPRLKGMGTTATVACVTQERLLVAQVGDSRAYLLRQGRLRQLTRDQTLVQHLVDRGQLSAEQAKSSNLSNVILQALGTNPEVDVVLTEDEVQPGDTLCLCSDGLSGVLEDATIEAVLLATESAEQACQELVERALDAGSTDNVTCVVARAIGPGPRPPRQPSPSLPPDPEPSGSDAAARGALDASLWSALRVWWAR